MPNKNTHRTALIDGDTLVYESTTATEKAIQWDGDLWTLHGFLPEAVEHFDKLVKDIREIVEADEVIIALSAADPQRWRESIMPTYKQHRRDKRKPLLYTGIRQHCHDTYKAMERPKLEGDDILGIMATHPDLSILKKGTERIVVSIDKDMKTIPGLHYNYGKEEFFSISEHDANYWHLSQAVTGDTTDGYPGCPGIGKVTADKLLAPYWEPQDDAKEPAAFDVDRAWKAIVTAYAKKGLSADVALLNARVARICRHTDYDLQKKEVILWNPPT